MVNCTKKLKFAIAMQSSQHFFVCFTQRSTFWLWLFSILTLRLYTSTLYKKKNFLEYLSLISKRNISKNTKMKLTRDSYIKFNVESVPGIHSSQNGFLPLQNELKFFNLDQNAISPVKFASKCNNAACIPEYFYHYIP